MNNQSINHTETNSSTSTFTYDIMGVDADFGELLYQSFSLVEGEELSDTNTDESCHSGVSELLIYRLDCWQHLLQSAGEHLGVEASLRPAKHAGHVGDERTQLVLQSQQLPQSFLHHGREGEQPQRVSGGRRVENHHREVHPLHQLHHLGIAHCLVYAREGAQQLLEVKNCSMNLIEMLEV